MSNGTCKNCGGPLFKMVCSCTGPRKERHYSTYSKSGGDTTSSWRAAYPGRVAVWEQYKTVNGVEALISSGSKGLRTVWPK